MFHMKLLHRVGCSACPASPARRIQPGAVADARAALDGVVGTSGGIMPAPGPPGPFWRRRRGVALALPLVPR